MLGFLRRSRLLSLALLFAAPGVAGTVLQAAHPCPAQAPWLAQTGGAPHGHHHGSQGSEPGAPTECHCIGTCHAASTWAPPAGGPVLAGQLAAQVAVARPAYTELAPAHFPYRFLPPATAPPLA